jgi:transposase
MVKILSKDMIQTHIVQHLSQGQRGPICSVPLPEVINAIFYKLKTGCQWEMLPVKALIISGELGWNAIYHHYRKWCKDGSWRKVWLSIMKAYKFLLDLSTSEFDGSHTPAKRGGQAVAYQRRKKCKTTNILLLTDRNGQVVATGKPLSGNHHDLYQIKEQLAEILSQLKEMDIPTDGLFLNADGGFDSKEFRQILEKEGIILNSPPNKRNASYLDSDILFDEEMYKERFAVERTNAWIDSFRTLLVRQDTTLDSWWAWHFIALTIWWIKHQIIPFEKL